MITLAQFRAAATITADPNAPRFGYHRMARVAAALRRRGVECVLRVAYDGWCWLTWPGGKIVSDYAGRMRRVKVFR